MSIYQGTSYEVPTDLLAVHERQIRAFGEPGVWWNGAQRLAILAEARVAAHAAGMQASDGGSADLRGLAEIPETARRIAADLAVTPQAFTIDVYEQVLSEGLTDAEYVELVGLVSRLSSFDYFARGIGAELPSLPAPEPGEPTRERPDTATIEGAWVPIIPNGKRGGEIGRELYGDEFMPYIFRSISLVPGEYRDHFELGELQYLPGDKFFTFDYQHFESLTRVQIEVVAGRVSALNECFY